MNDDLNLSLPPTDPPDDALLQRIQAKLAASSRQAVSPLPSNTVLMAIGLAIFAVVAFALAAVNGFEAIPVLSATEMFLYFGIVAALAILFARAVVERMIPGTKRVIGALPLWVTSFLMLTVLSVSIFADRSLDNFVVTGIPCLRLGSIGALISGLIGWRFLRRGYLVSPRETVLLYSFFAGLVGVAVLALHCPIRNSLHVVAWHLGAMVLAGIAALFLGRLTERDV
jgi:hypothetical protein